MKYTMVVIHIDIRMKITFWKPFAKGYIKNFEKIYTFFGHDVNKISKISGKIVLDAFL
jgi:hypothetical protein